MKKKSQTSDLKYRRKIIKKRPVEGEKTIKKKIKTQKKMGAIKGITASVFLSELMKKQKNEKKKDFENYVKRVEKQKISEVEKNRLKFKRYLRVFKKF